MGLGGKLYRQGLIKMNEFVSLCARDRIPIVWLQDTTGIDVGDDAERAELLGLGQSLIYSIQNSKLAQMEITVRTGSAAAHYVMGGPQGHTTNVFSLGTAATEMNVMNGETAAAAMYSRRLVKEEAAGHDLEPTIEKMNHLIENYKEKSTPKYCAKIGLVDEIVEMNKMRAYIIAFAEGYYQNPDSICPIHQMLTPRVIRDYDNLEMKQILDVVCAYLMMDDNGLLCNVYNTTELGEEDVTKLYVMDQDMFPGWLEEHQNALETMSDF